MPDKFGTTSTNVPRAVADDQRLEVFHAGKIISYPRHLDRLHYGVRPGSERPPASSFAASCKNIRVTRDTLEADCYRADQATLNHSSILIKGIRNVEGNLKFFSMDEPSSFQNSCSVISVGSGGNTLEAWCNQSGGAANKTSILIPGIHNNNGVLVYAQISSPPTPRCSAEQANGCRISRDQCLGMVTEAGRQGCHDGYRQCLSECGGPSPAHAPPRN